MLPSWPMADAVSDPFATEVVRRRSRAGAAQAPWILAAGVVVVLGAEIARVFRFTVDDAYITLRYARNVAEGVGATYNATGPRAEGYTSPAWMLLLTVPHLVGAAPLLFAKALGVLATIATALLVVRWTVAESSGKHAAAAGAFALVAYASLPRTAVHAVSGMETALFACLVTAVLATSSATIRRPSRRRCLALSSTCLLLGLTRPEGNLVAALAFGTTVVLVPSAARRALFRAAPFWLVPLAAYETWRFRYYGLPFPLPFYVKLAAPERFPGWPEVSDWLATSFLRLGVPLLAALIARRASLAPTWVVLAAIVFFFLFPQHLMGYEARYLAPFDPAVAALSGIGLSRCLEFLGRAGIGSRRTAIAAAALGTLAIAGGERDAPRVLRDRLDYADGLAAAHEELGRRLRGAGSPSSRLALADAGVIPYLYGFWTLDLVGLNDARVATTGDRSPARVLSAEPDVLVLVSRRRNAFEPWDWNAWERPIFEEASRRGFVRVGTRRFQDDYFLWVLVSPRQKLRCKNLLSDP
jgi:arabinofuranosyltransferase